MLPKEIEELLKEMGEEKIHGASYLAKMGARAYILLAERFEGEELVEKLKELGVEILNVNPTMASLYNLVRFMPVTPEPEFVKVKAEEFIKLSEEAKREIGNIGSELIDQNEVIITHSYSSTVFEILKKAKEKGKTFKVILTESGPDYEGLFLAKKLEEVEIPFEVITDAQLGLFAKKATLALVGADIVLSYYGFEAAVKMFNLGAIKCREKGNLAIIILKPGYPNATEILGAIADIHLKVTREHGTLLLYGIKPRTGLYGVEMDEEGIVNLMQSSQIGRFPPSSVKSC